MPMRINLKHFALLAACIGVCLAPRPVFAADGGDAPKNYNVLFIISDDLTATALSCYGNTVCRTPNIDRIAETGVRFTRAFCQGTYCGPSRASFLSGYYPHATGVRLRVRPRMRILRITPNTVQESTQRPNLRELIATRYL